MRLIGPSTCPRYKESLFQISSDAEKIIASGNRRPLTQTYEVPWGMVRRRVVTLNDGVVNKERSVAISCMHCTDAPCVAVCPVSCIYQTDIGVVLHNKDTCIGCGYCFYACPFGAPQYPHATNFGTRGKMDKCTFCEV